MLPVVGEEVEVGVEVVLVASQIFSQLNYLPSFEKQKHLKLNHSKNFHPWVLKEKLQVLITVTVGEQIPSDKIAPGTTSVCLSAPRFAIQIEQLTRLFCAME